MKTEDHISVRIFTGLQGEHFAVPAAVAVGSMTEGFQPFAPQLVCESEVWILQHRRNDTLYAKFSTDYLATDGKKAQVLICLFLPSGKKMDGGKSPFGMLNDLQELLLIYGVRGGRLIQQPMKIEPFNELVNEQRLRSLNMPLPVMAGSSPASYQVHNDVALDKLMRSSRFPALSTVAWLEVGRHCVTTINLTQQIINPVPPQDPNAGMEIVNISTGSSYAPYQAGASLGDETVMVEPVKKTKNNFVKKVFIAVASLLAFFLIVGLVSGGDETIAVDESYEGSAQTIETDGVQDEAPGALAEDSSQVQPGSETQPVVATVDEETLKEAEKEAERKKIEQQKAADEAKKAEEKKREEEKRKKDEEEQKKQAWQGQIKKHAQNCPIYLSSGGKLSSISFNDQSVTCIVDYPDLTMYDLSEKDRSALRSDVATVKKQYCGDLPSNINVTVIQKDRVGRNIH